MQAMSYYTYYRVCKTVKVTICRQCQIILTSLSCISCWPSAEYSLSVASRNFLSNASWYICKQNGTVSIAHHPNIHILPLFCCHSATFVSTICPQMYSGQQSVLSVIVAKDAFILKMRITFHIFQASASLESSYFNLLHWISVNSPPPPPNTTPPTLKNK